MQVLENTDGGATGSLIACLDMCSTVMGKRQLRAWLCRPMARIPDITARQDAVAELMGAAAEAAQAARSALTGKMPCRSHADLLQITNVQRLRLGLHSCDNSFSASITQGLIRGSMPLTVYVGHSARASRQ